MKPELILRSDLLDLIFENRNKEYGAYLLRKEYPRRLIMAMTGTALLFGLFMLLMAASPAKNISAPSVIPEIFVTDVVIPPVAPQDPQPPARPPAPTVNAAPPVITPDPLVDEPIATQDDMTNANPGTRTDTEPAGNGGDGPPVAGTVGQAGPPAVPAPEPVIEQPLEHADIMPSFNGDLQRFMLRNLRQPDDLEEGERIAVRVRFVVTPEGEIDDLVVVQQGRPDLAGEVLRVIRKMPRWRPGIQAGKPVPVYFNLPVIFVNNAE